MRIGAALHPLYRLVQRLHFPQPEARDQLLAFGEGPVDDGPLAARKPDARALRGRLKALARQHDAGLDQLFVELPHFGEDLLVGEGARLGVFCGFDDNHESHRNASF